jgi:hypothetical protein
MPDMQAIPADHPIMLAWNEWQETQDFANTLNWAKHDVHLKGSLWNAFLQGYEACYKELCDERA